MKKGGEIVNADEFISGKAKFEENDAYIKTEDGHTLKPELAEKVDAEAKHRWENGGKEIHDKWMADSTFAETEEYKNYFKKWGIPIPNWNYSLNKD